MDDRGDDPAGGDIVGLVLAAGASNRLGRPKQMLRFGDSTLLEHVVRGVEASTLDRVVVVVNDAVAASSFAGRRGRAVIVVNPDPLGGGSASSLRAGLAVAGDCAAVLILLGDMPGVDAGVVDHVIDEWRRRPTAAAVSRYADDAIAHPFVLAAARFDELLSLRGDKAVWQLVHGDDGRDVGEIRHDRPTPRDIDTWEDYVAVCAAAGVAPERSTSGVRPTASRRTSRG